MSTNTNPDFYAEPEAYEADSNNNPSHENPSSVDGSTIMTGSEPTTRLAPDKQMSIDTWRVHRTMEFEDGEETAQTGKSVCSLARQDIESRYFHVISAKDEEGESAQEKQPASSNATSAVSGRIVNPTLPLSTVQSGRITKPSVEASFAGSSQKRPKTKPNRFLERLTEDLRGNPSRRQ